MGAERQQREHRIVEAARSVLASERGEFLARECGGDGALRSRVERLLAQDASATATLKGEPLVGAGGGGARELAPDIGRFVGPYKLLSVLGEGGFGVVYLAQQTEPVERRVALKVIKPGMDSRQVLGRFEAERQALALMEHPHVAKVLDAGATADGRPYFVMEHVPGEAITAFCDRHTLGIAERLDLFIKVCEAVQHAHQKGIIHRDIKPSNILVSYIDGRATPKVIDFGVAKATARQLTERTVFTEQGQLIGTPEYMSPEQAEMSAVDIDTRSDIYSLGVLLYELLTGTLPFDARTLRSKALGEIQRIIREVEPRRPSTRLGLMGSGGADGGAGAGAPGSAATGAVEAIASRRRSDTRALLKAVRGDLDWIVMKCLEKDRSRRYETANALAMEIGRYRKNEPVLAGPPGAGYRVGKYIRRHRVGVAAAGLVAVSLVGSAAVSIGFAVSEARQRRVAEDQHRAADEQRALAEANERRAGVERDKAQRIAAFMSDTLKGVGPWVAGGRDTTLMKGMMNDAGARIENGELKGFPEAELELRLTIGSVYRELSDFEAAARFLKPTVEQARTLAALGSDAETIELARALSEWGLYLDQIGRGAEAEGLLAEALDIYTRVRGRDHPDVATAITNLAFVRWTLGRLPEAEPMFERALEMRRRLTPGDDSRVANSMFQVANIRQALGRMAEAEALFEQGLEMRRRLFHDDHPDLALGLGNLALARKMNGRAGEAEGLFEQGLGMWRRLFPGDTPTAATMLENMGETRLVLGRAAEAEGDIRQALEMYRRLYKTDHISVATALADLARARQAQGRAGEAEALLRESLEMRRRLFPGDHPDVAGGMRNLAYALESLGRWSEAEPLLVEALEMSRRLTPGDTPDVALSLDNLAYLKNVLGRPTEAEPLYVQALDMYSRIYAGDHPRIAQSMNGLGYVRDIMGRPLEAQPLYRQALEMRRRLFKGDHPDIAWSLSNLGRASFALEQFDEAEQLFREAVEMRRRLTAGDHPDLAVALNNLASVLRRTERPEEAETLLHQALEMNQRLFKGDHAEVAKSMANLAAVESVLGRHAEAVARAREAEAMARRVAPAGHPLIGALERNTGTVVAAAEKAGVSVPEGPAPAGGDGTAGKGGG